MVNISGMGNAGEIVQLAVKGLREVNETVNEVIDAANKFIEEDRLAEQRELLAQLRERLARLAAQLENLGRGGGPQQLALTLSRLEEGLDEFAISGGANQQDGQQMQAIREYIEQLRDALGGISPAIG